MGVIEGVGEADLLLVPKYRYLTIGEDTGILSRIKSLIAGFTMVPHAQAWADACSKATGAKSFGTYNGHGELGASYAIDTFSPVPADRRMPGTPGLQRVLGDDIADFSLETMRLGNPYGIYYVIWRQHIFNPGIADYWRAMATRPGGDTQNHFDHNHNSFNKTASRVIIPEPTPIPDDKEFIMSLSARYIYGGTDWVFDGPSHIYAQVGVAGVLKACDAVEMAELGKVDKDTHNWFGNVAAGWKDGR